MSVTIFLFLLFLQFCEAVNTINTVAQGRHSGLNGETGNGTGGLLSTSIGYDGPGELAAAIDDFDVSTAIFTKIDKKNTFLFFLITCILRVEFV